MPPTTFTLPGRDGTVEVSREPRAARSTRCADRLRSMQFHAESVLTRNGVEILGEVLSDLLVRAESPVPSEAGLSR